jgi:hypothetical protein
VLKKQWAAEINPPPTAFFIRSSAFSGARPFADNRKALWYHMLRPEMRLRAAPLLLSTANVIQEFTGRM